MKRKLITFITITSFLFIVACSDGPTEEGLSIEDILNNSIEAMQSLTSYSVEMDSHQTMGVSEQESFDMATQLKMDIALDPITFYQHTMMDMGIMGGIITYDSYYSEDHGLFMEDPYTEGWGKFPDSILNDFLHLSDEQINPEDHIKPLLGYVSELTLASEDQHYVISIKGEGTAVSSLLDHIMGMSGESMNEIMELVTELEIHSLEYSIYIDKETFYQEKTNVLVEMSMNIVGDIINTTQQSTMVMSRFNELDTIVIPNEVLEEAVEISENDLLGGF